LSAKASSELVEERSLSSNKTFTPSSGGGGAQCDSKIYFALGPACGRQVINFNHIGMNIKKGDIVLIRKGKDKGKTGKVIKVLPLKDKVIIESLNLVKKIQKAKKTGEKGEMITVPRPIPRANVMLICPYCKKPTRINYQIDEGNKFRICKKCNSKIS